MPDIDLYKRASELGQITVSQHAAKRMIERGIKIAQVRKAISTGEIIEDYPEAFPSPCSLISGDGLHVVAALNGDSLCIITAYRPDPERWEADLKTRRSEKQ